MKTEDRMTMQQAEKMMEHLRNIYTIVRLLDEDNFKNMKIDEDAGHKNCQCYSVWKKERPCQNCISSKVIEDKKQRSKLEFIDSNVFQVIARYVEIDGKPYVMELVSCMDDDSLVDAEGRDKLMKKLVGYNDELYKDAMTGAFNRRYFEEQLKQMTCVAGVAMIDLDDFKLYNDTYGHKAGDMVLVTAVQVIKRCIRKTDTLVRYGGDEFLLILPNIGEDIFTQKLQQIQFKIQDTEIHGYTGLHFSVSIGGVLTEDEMMEDAVVRADKLMYQAKNQKNMVITEQNTVNGGEYDLTSAMEKDRNQILIVDDSEMNREILAEMLDDKFQILEAADGEECVELLEQYGTAISIILLDIVMPVMDGFEVLSVMNKRHWIEDIPVIMISGEDSASYVRRAYELGVSDYISRPFDINVVYQRVFNTIKLYAKQRRLIALVTDQVYEKEKNNRMLISVLSQIVEFRNGESGLHVMHINVLTAILLERLIQKTDKYNLTWSDKFMISTASALHDIGKMGIDEKILNKPGKLTYDEFEIMKTHTLIGANMLKDLEAYREEKLIEIAWQICRWHHERYDGKGYPDGLKGDDIPIAAQVVSLADVYDALVSERVYKKAYSHEKAVEMILGGECGEFNPLLLECFTDVRDQIRDKLNDGSLDSSMPQNENVKWSI